MTTSTGATGAGEALDAVVRMVDLTTLEGADTPGQVAGLRAKARQPARPH